MLEVKDLHAGVEDQEILKGINLSIKQGQIHAIMGPNGSGKSTLAKILIGHPEYEATKGSVDYVYNGKKENLLEHEIYERARMGLFLSFQYPVEIPGVSNLTFLLHAYNAQCEAQGAPLMEEEAFRIKATECCNKLKLNPEFLDRSVNEGFSGGEKKKNEVLQMMLLSPRLCLLDETDSGLDIDALRTVADGVNSMKSPFRSIVLVTHYQRLLDYIQPDFVHVLADGKIVKSGDMELAKELEKKGYDWLVSH